MEAMILIGTLVSFLAWRQGQEAGYFLFMLFLFLAGYLLPGIELEGTNQFSVFWPVGWCALAIVLSMNAGSRQRLISSAGLFACFFTVNLLRLA